MMKKKTFEIICVAWCLAILGVLIWYYSSEKAEATLAYEDGIHQVDLNQIKLEDSGVTVEFAEVIVGKHEERRQLIVSVQEATVSAELTDRIIEKLDFDFLKKTQKVSYTGTGYFVVDLDKIAKNDIIDDKANKVLTIKIENARLELIEINPDKIMIAEVKEGLFARGDIEMTVSDYNAIEKELRNKLEAKFDTVKNGQEANEIALRMVKEIYEPIVKAIDAKYSVVVEFK